MLIPVSLLLSLKFLTAFHENRELTEEVLIKKAIAFGRYQAREIRAISQLHKYRTMRMRYNL